MDLSTLLIVDRVFHIDDECYIIFLGESQQDNKPFLRIGNSQSLTEEIISNIYNIVITDSYTGNPFLEPENVNRASREEYRYVGDRDTIGTFVHLIQNLDIDTNRIDVYREIETSSKRAVVFFYDDGNLHLYYDQTLMFDLKSREKKDLHFIEKTELIKDRLTKSPLRYPADTFKTPGFFLLDQTVILFNEGKLISQSIPENYFYKISKLGIDPDLIAAVLTEEVTASLFYLVKRKQYRKEPLDIVTSRPPLIRSVTDLFTKMKTDPLKAKIVDMGSRREVRLDGFAISKDNGLYSFTHNSIPFPIALAREKNLLNAEQIIVDSGYRRFYLPGKDQREMRRIPEGIPHVLIGDAPPEEELITTYFTEPASFYSELVGADETILLRHLTELFEGISHEQLLPPSTPHLKRELKRIKLKSDTAFIFPLLNATEICTCLMKSGKYTKDIKDALNSIRKEIDRALGSVESFDIQLPLTCDCYIAKEKSYLLYRLAKSGTEVNDYRLSRDAFSFVDETLEEKHQLHTQEKQRLSALIGELSKYQKETRMPVPVQEEEIRELTQVEERVERREPVIGPSKKREGKRRVRVLVPLGVIAALGIALLLLLILPERGKIRLKQGWQLIAKRRGAEVAQDRLREEASKEGLEEAGEISPQEGEAAGEYDKQLSLVDAILAESPPTFSDIEITLLDVYLLTNRIAATNGYRELDSIEQVGKDPDWIYPGNLLVLPDGREQSVVKDDTMWDISEGFIMSNLERDWKIYINIMKEIEKNENSAISSKNNIEQLEALKKRSYSENFTRVLDRAIDALAK